MHTGRRSNRGHFLHFRRQSQEGCLHTGDARFEGACFRSLGSSQDGSGINSSSRKKTSRTSYSRQVVEWKWENQRGRNKKVLSGAMAEVDNLMNNHGLDSTDLVSQIHSVIIGRRLSVPQSLRYEILDALSECDVGLQRSTYPRIHFERFLHRTAIAGKKHGLSM